MANDICEHLGNLGLIDGQTGWLGCVAFTPPHPAQVVVLGEYSGNGRALRKDLCDEPGLQVKVRGDEFGYAAALDKLEAIIDAINACDPFSINGVHYRTIKAVGGLLPLGVDEQSNRPILVQNFIAWRSR